MAQATQTSTAAATANNTQQLNTAVTLLAGILAMAIPPLRNVSFAGINFAAAFAVASAVTVGNAAQVAGLTIITWFGRAAIAAFLALLILIGGWLKQSPEAIVLGISILIVLLFTMWIVVLQVNSIATAIRAQDPQDRRLKALLGLSSGGKIIAEAIMILLCFALMFGLFPGWMTGFTIKVLAALAIIGFAFVAYGIYMKKDTMAVFWGGGIVAALILIIFVISYVNWDKTPTTTATKGIGNAVVDQLTLGMQKVEGTIEPSESPEMVKSTADNKAEMKTAVKEDAEAEKALCMAEWRIMKKNGASQAELNAKAEVCLGHIDSKAKAQMTAIDNATKASPTIETRTGPVVTTAPITPAAGSNGIPISVPGNQQWFDTGIDIPTGADVVINANGRWSNGGSRPVYCSPRGFAPTAQDQTTLLPKLIVPSGWLCQLVGKTNTGSFVVGEHYEGKPGSGRLFLSLNDTDGGFGDNPAANLDVTIEVKAKK